MTTESVHAGSGSRGRGEGLCIPSVCSRHARLLGGGLNTGAGQLASISFPIGWFKPCGFCPADLVQRGGRDSITWGGGQQRFLHTPSADRKQEIDYKPNLMGLGEHS